MLYLIQRNRLGKNIINKEDCEIDWRTQFKNSEDSLTSSIFSLLFYLPLNIFWNILTNACYSFDLPEQTGEILLYEFWPHWKCDGTNNQNFIEPDLFIRFQNFDIIIEAKRWDYFSQQNKKQWEAQLKAYSNEYAEDNKKVYFIALSGLIAGEEFQIPVNDVSIFTCRWHRILEQVQKNVAQNAQLESNVNLKIILNDLLIAFALHDFRIGDSLNTLSAKYSINYPISFDEVSRMTIKWNLLLSFKLSNSSLSQIIQ